MSRLVIALPDELLEHREVVRIDVHLSDILGESAGVYQLDLADSVTESGEPMSVGFSASGDPVDYEFASPAWPT